ncbi:hypothetical protein [Streptomyces sp. CA-111067]|uniref:hypothetical protein n=1 Tax=Streptomyces sp. CA-111067 TaxID=3240046 RepID=UPI003D96F2CC
MRTNAVPVRVTGSPTAPTPSSPLLYGQFIELGYGIQTEGMRAELLFNPGFTRFAPYRGICLEWFDLLVDRDDPAKGFHTDWSVFDWYHSGYEHNAWFAAPGPMPSREVLPERTYVVPNSPSCLVRLERSDTGERRGAGRLRILNEDPQQWAGAAQRGLRLRPGGRYRLRVQLRSAGEPVPVEARLYREGDWRSPLAVADLGTAGAEAAVRTAELHMPPGGGDEGPGGSTVLAVLAPPGAVVDLDEVSLTTEDSWNGWRREVVEELRRVRPGIIRWTGGCTASFHDWREGVGPVAERPALPGYFWGGLEDNCIGTAELAALARELGAESMACVNLHHPDKRHWEWRGGGVRHGHDLPAFTDPEQGVRSAADWVAYCNLPADGEDAHPMARLRAEHGHPEPFAVRYWEMDNEPLRWFTPEEYARTVVTYATAMRAVDPSIRIGLVSYGWEKWDDGTPASVLPLLLEIAGAHVDFLADRGFGEEDLERKLAHLEAFNREHGTDIRYCNTEWLAYDGVADATNRRETFGATKSELFASWRYALNIARHFLMWQRYGDRVDFVNFNNLANTHGQNVIDTPKEGVRLSAAGLVFELLTELPQLSPLRSSGLEPSTGAERQVQCAWDADGERLVVTAVSLADEDTAVSIDLSALGRGFARAQTTVLSAKGPWAAERFGRPEEISRTAATGPAPAEGEALARDLPAWSLVTVVLS